MATLAEEELKKLQVAHREGVQAGVEGKQVNCPYQPDSKEMIFWAGYRGDVSEGPYRQGSKKAAYYKQGKIEGHNFRLKADTLTCTFHVEVGR